MKLPRRVFPSLLLLLAAGGVASALAAGCATSNGNSSTSASAGAGGGMGSGGAGGSTGSGGSGGASSSTIASTGSGGSGGAASVCGNGVMEAGEACDGSDFGGKTCADYGLEEGQLQCNPTCAVVVSGCSPPETCGNGQDDDNDFAIDCADSDCAEQPDCKDSCASPKPIGDGEFDIGSTQGRPDTLKGSCTPSSGPEAVYQYVAQETAQLAVVLGFSDADMSVSVRTICGNAASEIACANDGMEFDPEKLVVNVTKGQKYFIVIDGVSPMAAGMFGLDVLLVKPESDCANYADDDLDDRVDCADPSNCQSSSDCTSGPGAVGAPCGTHNQCHATGNDPLCIDDLNYGWPNGYCSEYCTIALNDCPSGSRCVDPSPLGGAFAQNGLGICLKTCTKKADCAAAYLCSDFGAGFVCAH